MIDTHTHLTDPRFSEDMDQVLLSAREAGVRALICPATSYNDSIAVSQLCAKYEQVYGLVGIYPGEANQESWESDLAKIWNIAKENQKIVGIGEIGLDATPLGDNPELEYKVFEKQLDYAAKNDFPVVIHTRNTERETWDVFRRFSKLPRGHMHCFSGSNEWLDYVLSRGFFVGFDGNVTYKSASNLRELAKRVPLERLLLESDSPYLPPEGKRGERNESANVKIIAAFLAELRGEKSEELILQTSKNAKELYGI